MASLKLSFVCMFLAAAVLDTTARSIYRPDADPEESRSRRDVTAGDVGEEKRGQVTTHSLNIIRQTPNAPLIQHAHSDTTSKARVSQSHRRNVDDQNAQTRSGGKARSSKGEDLEEETEDDEAEDASGEPVENSTQKEALPVSIAAPAVAAGQVVTTVPVAPQAQQNPVITAAQVPALQIQAGIPAPANQLPASVPANQLRCPQGACAPQQAASAPAPQLYSQPLTGNPMVAHNLPTHAGDQVVNKGPATDKEGSAEDDDDSSAFEDDDEYTAEDKRKISESKSSSKVLATAPQAPLQLVPSQVAPVQQLAPTQQLAPAQQVSTQQQVPVQRIVPQQATSNHPELIAAAMPVATVQQSAAAIAPQSPAAATPVTAGAAPVAAAAPAAEPAASQSPAEAKAASKAAAAQAAMQEPITAKNIRKYLKPIKFGGSLKAMPKIKPQDDFLKEIENRKKLKQERRKKSSEKSGKGKE